MKKKILFSTCMIIISCLTFVAADCNTCKKSDPNYPDCNPEPEPEYPIDIPFTFYSLSGTSCQWIELDNNDGRNYHREIVVINSNEELENYITCTGGTYPAIDFSKYTLILARGAEPHPDFPDKATLQQLSAQSYVMTVNLLPSAADVDGYWKVSIIVNKIAANSVIELIITNNFQE